jgi:hypothetical protein
LGAALTEPEQARPRVAAERRLPRLVSEWVTAETGSCHGAPDPGSSHDRACHRTLVDHVHPFQDHLFERPLCISHFFGIGTLRGLVDAAWTSWDSAWRLVASTR